MLGIQYCFRDHQNDVMLWQHDVAMVAEPTILLVLLIRRQSQKLCGKKVAKSFSILEAA